MRPAGFDVQYRYALMEWVGCQEIADEAEMVYIFFICWFEVIDTVIRNLFAMV